MMVYAHGIAYILLLFLQGSPAVLFRKNGRVVEGNALLTRQSPKAARRFESFFFRINRETFPDGLVVKLREKDGTIDIETSWLKAKLEDYLPFVKDQMADCFESFDEFRKKHPNFHEMHFMTDQTVWEKDLDEEAETQN